MNTLSRDTRIRFIDDKSVDSKIAKDLLKKSGFHIMIYPEPGKVGPEIKVKGEIFFGLEQIKTFLSENKLVA